MPNAREFSLTPSAITPQATETQNIAQDIMNFVKGAGSVAQMAAQTAADIIQKQNKDIATYQSFQLASEKAKKELGIEEKKVAIQENQQQIQAINTIEQWYNNLKQQERVGLVAIADGRSPEELQQMLKNNPGIVDPDNLLDYKRDVAKALAVQDANEIFLNIEKDANKFDAPQKTITQHLEEKVAARAFPDDDSKRSYLETLAPMVARQNQDLMMKAWELQREKAVETSAIEQMNNFVSEVKSGTLSGDKLDNILMEYVSKSRQYFPEKSEKEAKGKFFKLMSGVLVGEGAIVDPYEAKQALMNVMDNMPPAWSKNSENKSWISSLQSDIDSQIRKYENDYKSSVNETIGNITTSSELESSYLSFQQEKNNLSPFVYNEIQGKFLSQRNSLREKNSKQFSDRLEPIQTREGLSSYIKELSMMKSSLGQVQYDTLIKKAEEKGKDLEFAFQVQDRMNDTPGSETIAFGKNHEKYINETMESLKISGISLGDRMNISIQKFGILTDQSVTELNDLGNSADPAKMVEATVAVSRLDSKYLDRLFNSKDSKLDGRFRTIAYVNKAYGLDPATLVSETFATPPEVFAKSMEDTVTKDVPSINQTLVNTFSSWYKIGETPDVISPRNLELATETYKYHFARLAAKSPSSKAEAIAKEAMKMMSKTMEGNLVNVDIGGKKYLLSAINSINSGDMELADDAIFTVMNKISKEYAIDSDSLSLDIDNARVDSDSMVLDVISNNGLINVKIGEIKLPGPATEALGELYKRTNIDELKRQYGSNYGSGEEIFDKIYKELFTPTQVKPR